MQRVTCSFCGLPFSVRRADAGASHYCCSGCALASRIPLGRDGALPVSAGLVAALAFGFGLFNQVLFALLGGAVAAEGRPDVGARLLLVSGAVGLALALVGTALALVPRGRSGGDIVVGALVAAIASWLGWVMFHYGASLATTPLIAVNLVLAAWTARGWAWRAAVRKRKGLQI